MYRIVHTIFEGQTPVVQHVFFGATRERAMEVYAAHRQSDSFLRECDDKGVWKGPRGDVQCSSQVYEIPG
jgi:hypothetical protein